jgi:hypothetical protein
MKYLKFSALLIGLVFLGCNPSSQKPIDTKSQTASPQIVDIQKEKNEIQVLIRQVLIWSDTCKTFELYPAISDEHDSLYIGFDMNKVNGNITILRQTGFFSKGFIEKYNQIIRTLDKKLRNKEIEWLVGDMQTFNFNMSYIDVNPWCLCQGFSISQFDDIEIVNLNNSVGDLKFKWTQGSDWIDFKFSVVKEDNRWKISYMEGFDFKENKEK